MKFEIESKYDIDSEVITKNNHCAKIVDRKMRQVGKVVNIEYLLEFEDGERHWQDEETLE